MKKTWRKLLAAVCAASMLMTLPGVSVYAADMSEPEDIEICEEMTDETEKSGDTLKEDKDSLEPEIAAEALEQPEDTALTEMPEEAAETVESVEIDELYQEEQEDVAETVDLPTENVKIDEATPTEEIVGATYTVGNGVKATYYPDTGRIVLYNSNSATSGTLWSDWLESAGISRKSVTSISVSQSTSAKKIKLPMDSSGLNSNYEKRLFGGLENLVEIDLTGFDTSNVTNMHYMFGYCTKLKDLDFSGFDTSKVTDMSAMFMQCYSLQSLNLKSFNTSNVTDMSGMFDDCTNLTLVNVSSFRTSKVKDMGCMFQFCKKLTSVDVSRFDVSNVTDMIEMFGFCESLTRLDLRNFNTSKLKAMDFAFRGCKKLRYLDIGSFDMSTVKSWSGMLDELDALDILITPHNNKEEVYLSKKMYDRNGKGYTTLKANSKSMVLGRTKALAASIFIDVRDPNHAYYDAIYWAVDKGITKGYSDGTFGINRSCTRGEMVMFLWRYAGQPAPKPVSKSPFKDVPTTHTFYKAILWAYQKGITKGYSDGTFGINKNVSRGESMMFLWRLKGKPEPMPASVSPFKDVPKNHVFYKAILWGYQKKITTGYTSGVKKGTFGINENCTRGQIVTFLYRARNL